MTTIEGSNRSSSSAPIIRVSNTQISEATSRSSEEVVSRSVSRPAHHEHASHASGDTVREDIINTIETYAVDDIMQIKAPSIRAAIKVFQSEEAKGTRNVEVLLGKGNGPESLQWLSRHREGSLGNAKLYMHEDGRIVIIKVPDVPHGGGSCEMGRQIGNTASSRFPVIKPYLTACTNSNNDLDGGGLQPDVFIKSNWDPVTPSNPCGCGLMRAVYDLEVGNRGPYEIRLYGRSQFNRFAHLQQ